MGGRKLGDSTLPPLETTAVRTVGKGKGKGKVQDSTPGIWSGNSCSKSMLADEWPGRGRANLDLEWK